ncbi:MAG: DUF2971 domain-containing protein [Sneathiella sp.]
MSLPPLYKYLDVHGAKLTLGNQTFKHTKPSDFNDTEDLTLQSIFPEDTETALKKIEANFTDVVLKHLNDQPTCSSPMKEKLELIQAVYHKNPKLAEIIKAENRKLGPAYDYGFMREKAEAFIAEVNEFMQGYRILCVTTHLKSEKMWDGYAGNHKGIALRIEPNLAKDSKFKLFRPVVYQENRPPLYDDTLAFISDSLFGDQRARNKAILDKIIYAKTLKWAHEGEYRLAIALRQGEPPWDTLKYHSEEITELYLGFEMEKSDMEEIGSLARTVNPDISIFQTECSADGELMFVKT